MKQGVTLAEMNQLIGARLNLLQWQHQLWMARISGAPPEDLRLIEENVYLALDWVWETQRRAA